MPKKILCFLGILLASLCLAASGLRGEEPQPLDLPAQSADLGTPVATTPAVDNAVQKAQEEVRDPFGNPLDQNIPTDAAGVSANAPEIKVELQGIGFGSKDAYAVIGGEVFSVGDEKKGIKLLEVRRHEVDILVNGGKTTFPLFPGPELKNTKERELSKRTGAVLPINQPKKNAASFPEGEQPLS